MYNVYGLKWCIFCLRAINLLHEKGQKFSYYPMDKCDNALNFLKESYDHKTVPIITIDLCGHQKLIGGYDDLVEHFRKQEDKESNRPDS